MSPTALVVKASFGNSLTRRVTFPNADAVYYEQFKQKLGQCFSLEPSSFRIAYRDDDGDQTELATADDLIEAIAYFNDDPDAAGASNGSGGGSAYSGAGSLDGRARGKITMRVICLVDYEGPSLSDGGSLSGSEASGSEWGGESSRRGHELDSSEYSAANGRGRAGGRGGKASVWDERSHNGGQRPQQHYNNSYPGTSNPPPIPPRSAYSQSGYGGSYPPFQNGGASIPRLPPPPRPPLPPPPPSSYRPFTPSVTGNPSPYEFDDMRSEISYGGPPGRSPEFSRPTPMPRHADSGSSTHTLAALKPVNGDIAKLQRRTSAYSSSSSSSSSHSGVGRAGRRFRGKGSQAGDVSPGTTPDQDSDGRSIVGGVPLSAPPTYASGSQNGDEGEDLQQRWLRAQRVRGKGKQRALSVSGSEASDDLSEINYNNNGNHQQLDSSRFASTSQQPIEFDLPTLLADLSLSRMPAPSILSAVPDELLRCCGCSRIMEDFRYVCCLCGPILPSEALSDDGTQMDRKTDDGNDSDDAASANGTVVSYSTETDNDETGETSGLLDNAARVDPAQIALPLSPTTSPPTSANGSVPVGHVHNHTDPECSPVLSVHQKEEAQQSMSLVLATAHDHSHHRYGEEDRGGYELCSECVETEGVKHAAAMAKLAKERPLEEGETMIEVRHSFAEVMKTSELGGGWREVDYEDDVTCTICGEGPCLTNRFKCLSCTKFEMCLSCFRAVDEIHPVHSFLSVPDRPARPTPDAILSSPPPANPDGHATVEDLRLAFLRARGLVGPNGQRPQDPYYSNSAASMPPRTPPKLIKHPGVLCFGCLGDIVGPRYSCSVCLAFDLCQNCEALDPPITSPDGRHEPSHILLKITVPATDDAFEDASDRARLISRDSGGSDSYRRGDSPPGRRGERGSRGEYDRSWHPEQPSWRDIPPPPRHDPYHHHQPPPTWGMHGPLPPPHYPRGGVYTVPPWERGPHRGGGGPPVYIVDPATGALVPQNGAGPLARSGAADAHGSVVHHVACRRCDRLIQGIRWLCAQCPTTPSSYDLCSTCERMSHTFHNQLHCFLRITRPLYKPLPPLSQLLPILYDPSSPAHYDEQPLHSSASSRSDGTSRGDGIVLHQNVICDNCLEPISGAWMRCCHCPGSFDLCVSCLSTVQHDEEHVFVKFTRKVDMVLFRSIARLSTSPVPLLSFSIYT